MATPQPIPRIVLDDTETRENIQRRISALIDQPSDEDCWQWLGHINRYGYVRISINIGGKRRWFTAHRLTYAWEYGDPYPSGLDHLCGNRSCVNPRHLQAVSQRTNTLRGDGPTARNAQKTHCSKGHPFYGDNLYIEPSGRRRCRACVAARGKAWKEKVNYGHYGKGKRGKRRQGANRTECIRGHPSTPENTYYRASGAVECRVCHRERN